jgi:GntR family carbon starvation induced transcriptional regulator
MSRLLGEHGLSWSIGGAQRKTAAAPTLESTVRQQLRADILSGRLLPCDKLRVAELSTRYAAAGTTIREALSRLVSEGLVTSEANKGFRVAPASLDGLLDLTGTRKVIEAAALRLAIQHGDSAWEAEIVGQFHQLSRASPDPAAFLEWEGLHRSFHHALLAACGLATLLDLAGRLYDLGQRYRALMLDLDPQGGRDLLAEHRALMDAALAHEADKGVDLLCSHLDYTYQVISAAGKLEKRVFETDSRRGVRPRRIAGSRDRVS